MPPVVETVAVPSAKKPHEGLIESVTLAIRTGGVVRVTDVALPQLLESTTNTV